MKVQHIVSAILITFHLLGDDVTFSVIWNM